jgi:lysine biosynthesis protein LysW
MITVYCIDCEQEIRLETRPVEGEVLFCSNCGAEFEVISVEPIELDWVFLEPIKRETDRFWHSESQRSFPI